VLDGRAAGARIGAYRIDLHPSTGGDPCIDLHSHPFEIPLGALVPQRLENLVAAGEAAGHLVAHCTARGTTPRAVQAAPGELQRELDGAGVELHWAR
jgi:FAD dependent oxidoreductase